MEILTASDRDFHLSPPALPTAATDLFLGCSFLYCSLNSSLKSSNQQTEKKFTSLGQEVNAMKMSRMNACNRIQFSFFSSYIF
uniref:Uncharacterized protein MANES_18G003900 n=1 Tax=Rhizophora mucronata TaxID=61149 RepID=A0A2P2M696_RHIMU